MVTKVCYVGEGFTRKPPKYERFIRPMVSYIFTLLLLLVVPLFFFVCVCADLSRSIYVDLLMGWSHEPATQTLALDIFGSYITNTLMIILLFKMDDATLFNFI